MYAANTTGAIIGAIIASFYLIPNYGILGTAQVAGNAMFLDYVLTIQLSDGTIDVAVDDRMYLVSQNVLINESSLKKFGVPVGGILLTIIRYPEEQVECPAA